MKKIFVFVMGLVVGLGLSCFGIVSVSLAQQPANPCMGDAEKLCGDVQKGGGRVMDCLASHSSELSPDCRKRVELIKGARESFMRDCGADINRFCGGVQPGGGRVFECLNGHSSELSSSCSVRLKSAGARRGQGEAPGGR